MSKTDFIKQLITSPATRMYFLSSHGFYKNMSDEDYLRKMWRYRMGGELDLEHPQTFCEKLQWLKVYNQNPEYSKYVDKYEVKQIVAKEIGAEHVIPIYGVWNSFDEIDFNELPDRFILKTTHDSGGFMICRDKKDFDRAKAGRKFDRAMKRNYYWGDREWPYKNVRPRIIAEEYIDSLGKPESIEYKLTCMNGKLAFTTVCTGIAHSAFENRTNDSFDPDGNHMPWYAYYKNSTKPVELPEQLPEMIGYAEKLSTGIPYARVDFYIIDGQVFFGEMTFFTWAGFIEFTPPEWDRILGDMLILPEKYNN